MLFQAGVMKRIGKSIFGVIAGGIILFSGASPAGASDLELVGAGSSFSAPLYNRWAAAFRDERPDINVTYSSVGSAEGVERFLAGSVDFGSSDTVLTPGEISRAPCAVTMVPVTAGMVVLAYNLPGLNGQLRLSPDTYSGIFAGTVRYWDDPLIAGDNPGIAFPHQNIAAIVRLDGSGTTNAFSSHLKAASRVWTEREMGVGKSIGWPGSFMQAKGNEGVSAKIRLSEWSIGYVEYGFAIRLGLHIAALRNADGKYVLPSAAAGRQALEEGNPDHRGDPYVPVDNPRGAGSYPIVTYSWAFLCQSPSDSARARALWDFIRFGLGKGQNIGEAMGYIALPSSISRLAAAAVGPAR